MDVAAMSMAISSAQVMQQVNVSLAKGVMDLAQQQGNAIVEMANVAQPPSDTIAINMRV